MVIPKEQILNYIAQRAPLVMIDNLLSVTSKRFESDFQIVADNVFLEEGVFSEFGLVENILQSCTAGLAVINRSGRREPVNGFVGAISKLKVHSLPGVHDNLRTIITPIAELGDWYLAKGETFLKEKKLLECEVKLVGSGT